MANFDELKRKAAEAAEVLADKSLVLAKKAAEKTKDFARVTKLTAEIAAEKENVRRCYAELGKAYYEKYKDDPADDMAQTVGELTLSLEAIEAKRAEIDSLKSDSCGCDAGCEAEYEPADEPEPEPAEEAEKEPEAEAPEAAAGEETAE